MSIAVVAALASPLSMTQAGFIDVVHADAVLQTEKKPVVNYFGQNTLSAASGAVVGSDGSVWVTGYRPRSNASSLKWAGGYAGNGNDASLTTGAPVAVTGFGAKGMKAVKVAAASKTGSNTAAEAFAALTGDGRVFGWGSNYAGMQNVQNVSTKFQLTPTEIVVRNSDGVKQKIVDLQSAHQQFFALTDAGELYVWGYTGWQTRSGVVMPDFGSGHILSTDKQAREEESAAWGAPTLFNSRFFDRYIVPYESTTCTQHPVGGVISGYDAGSAAKKVHSMSVGANGGLLVTQTGVVYSWGYNTLGVGSFYAQTRDFANQKTSFGIFSQMDCPRVAFGVNSVVNTKYSSAELAAGCAGTVSAVDRVSATCPVRQVGSRDRANQMVLQNGELYTWGTGRMGTLDVRKYLGRTPSALSINHPLYTVLEWDGPVQEWPSSNAQENDGDYPVKVDAVSTTGDPAVTTSLSAMRLGVREVANGLDHTLLLMADGTVYGYGSDSFCQATGIADSVGGATCKTRAATAVPTLNTSLSKVGKASQIAAGTCWSYATTPDGKLYGWGGRYARGSYDTTAEAYGCAAADPAALTAYGDHLPTSNTSDPYGDTDDEANTRIPTIELVWKW
ncbi:hypothetical protein [Leucobacter coleopterorum]|nr:hypothetical protein [Leucobacter coleopterorum]